MDYARVYGFRVQGLGFGTVMGTVWLWDFGFCFWNLWFRARWHIVELLRGSIWLAQRILRESGV